MKLRSILPLAILLSIFTSFALPQGPEWLKAVPASNVVNLSWSAVEGAASYNVKRSASISGPFSTAASNITATAFQDTTARNNTPYFYAVSAQDEDGEGPATMRVRAVPSAAVAGWLPEGAKLEKLAGGFQFTEGPLWMRDNYLIFSDIPANRLYQWSEASGATVFRAASGQANGNTVDLQGRLITCEHANRRVSRTESNGVIIPLVTNYNARRFNAPNDATVKSDGTIWFTDPNYGAGQLQPGRWVYRFHPDDPVNTLRTVVTNFDQPNGIAFSPDESKLYIADSGGPRHVRVFDVLPDNTLTNSKVFASINPGNPDGMRVDNQGRLYVTAGDGVQIFAPGGELLDKIRTPETAANVAFGGENGDQLFITANTSLYGITRKPDLIVASIQRFPANPLPGQAVKFLCTIKNQGTGALPVDRLARVNISIGDQTNLLSSSSFSDLPPDASLVLLVPSKTDSPWIARPGSHRVHAVVQAEAGGESNGRNNQTNLTLSIPQPGVDADQDGSSDSDEQLAGTDPSDSASVLRILALETAPANHMVLSWASQEARSYKISLKRSLRDLEWIEFPTPVPSAGGITRWTNSIRDRALFRIRLVP